MSNKKRIKKGIDSLEKQIKIHEEKRKIAQEEGEIELEDYYNREIKSLKKAKEKKNLKFLDEIFCFNRLVFLYFRSKIFIKTIYLRSQ